MAFSSHFMYPYRHILCTGIVSALDFSTNSIHNYSRCWSWLVSSFQLVVEVASNRAVQNFNRKLLNFLLLSSPLLHCYCWCGVEALYVDSATRTHLKRCTVISLPVGGSARLKKSIVLLTRADDKKTILRSSRVSVKIPHIKTKLPVSSSVLNDTHLLSLPRCSRCAISRVRFGWTCGNDRPMVSCDSMLQQKK